MRILTSLVQKELHDARGFLLLAAALLVALTAGAKLAFGGDYDARMRAEWVTPLALAVVAVVLSAEAIGRDAASGVDELWQRVPVDRAVVWLAKLVAVVAGTALFAGAARAVEWTTAAVEHGPALRRGDPISPYVVAFGCLGAFASAAVLRRSLPAALAGAGLAAGVPLLVPVLLPRLSADALLLLGVTLEPWGAWLGALLAGALLAVSLAAFRACEWGNPVARRAARAALATVLVLGPTLGVSAATARRRARVELFDPTAELLAVAPSPDGRFVAVGAERYTPFARVSAVWLLDRSRGTWRGIDGDEAGWPDFLEDPHAGESAWTPDGRLALRRLRTTARGMDGTYELYDARRDETVWTRTQADDGWEAQREARGLPAPWFHGRIERGEWVVTFGDQEWRCPRERRLARGPEPGIVFTTRANDVLRVDLATGEERVLYTMEHAEHASLRVSPQGEWLACQRSSSLLLLDAHTGRVVHRVENAFVSGWCRAPGRVAFLNLRPRGARPIEGAVELLHADGERTVLTHDRTWHWVEDGADALLRYRYRGRRGNKLERTDLEGNVLEVLIAGER